MSDNKVIIKVRNFISNNLMQRKQFKLEAYHIGKANVSKEDLCKLVAAKFKVSAEQVVCFGFETKFGGGKSIGTCLIYDSLDSRKKFEPYHRLLRSKIIEKRDKINRRRKKNTKIKCRKLRGKDKVKAKKA